MQRYFAINKETNNFILEESDYHHIKNVMRMNNKEQVEIIYNHTLFLGHIENIETDFQIICDEQLDSRNLNAYIILVIPILKEQKMDYILQKATELGVSEIIPVQMERCMVKIVGKEQKKKIRWQKIVKEASEQSKRYDIPIIRDTILLNSLRIDEGVKLVCSTSEITKNIKNVMKTIHKYDRISVVIGPEGGLTKGEENQLIKDGFIPISLGNQILRVETVPLYLLSILNYENLL